jgi:hypothetical protein
MSLKERTEEENRFAEVLEVLQSEGPPRAPFRSNEEVFEDDDEDNLQVSVYGLLVNMIPRGW